MKQVSTLLFALLMLLLVACGGVQGSEPAAVDSEPEEAVPTADPDESVSSEDPTTEPVPTEPSKGDLLIDAATVESIQINVMESFPVQVSVTVGGYLGDGCTGLGDITTEREGDTFLITITTERPADAICTQQLVGFEETVSLDVVGLEAGTYTVNANGVTDTFTLAMDNVLPDEDTGETDTSGVELSAADRAELIRLTLARALIDREIPDYNMLTEGQAFVVLSTENIDPSLVPELDGVMLDVLTPEEIQAKADADGDFLYLRFQDVTAVSADEARVSLANTWAIASDSDQVYLSGGGFTIEYTRTTDGWQGEVTEAWIS